MGKEEIARNEQFLLSPQWFLLNQIIVSSFVLIFDIISLFAAESEEPEIGIWGKGLNPDEVESLLMSADETCTGLLSHNNHCFPCNRAIMNFLILYTCEIRFYDVTDSTVHMFLSWCHPMQKFQNMAKWVCFGPLFFNLIRLIQLCDKKNLTFVDCWDKMLFNLSWKTLLSSPKACLITFFKSRLIKFYLNS